MTFEEQIINDIKTKIPSGVCEKFPKGTSITNVKIGEIVDIGIEGMTDVSYEFDYKTEDDAVLKHEKSALLYIKVGKRYTLASMGSDCEI